MKITRRQLRRIIKETVRLSDYLSINKSPIHGVGVFAQTNVPAGTDLGAAQTRLQDGSHDVTDLGRYHNHSEEPSCRNELVGDTRHLIAAQDLSPGDEVTINYRLQPELEQPETGWNI